MSESYLFIILSGLSIGILGSFHCVGMCGPIALSLPVGNLPGWRKISAIGLYNIGRALSYAGIGLVLGLLGSSFNLFGWQQGLSVAGGILILIFLLLYYFKGTSLGIRNRFSVNIQNRLGAYLRTEKTAGSFLMIGILNGFLPCGLVYMAMATAFSAGSPWKGALLMFAFGLGTIPMMAGLILAGKLISVRFRTVMYKMVPYWLAAMAVVLIVRGLNLGIPYLSPSYNAEEHCVKHCCAPE